ncbi:hypothetical protein F443_12958 [Phytophthora nicotianae P1569]|uniref:BZIP domain-containing protein n=1 Tax=Phytophthora nicotianae P1569 TaxID=1317065 RepID=V9ESI4_PHYNI|nr:hypothetical protein F443_12958 [Phytophthora nicotianae P1569]
MKVSTLFSRNREHVSDVVIGSVILRSEHYHNYYRNDTSEWRTDRCSPTSSSSSSADIKSGLDFIDAIRLPGITGHKRAHTDTLNCRTPYSELHQTHAVSSAIDVEAKYAAELEFRRRRNRIHKARYKMKQRKLEMDLVESVANLKDEVQELKMQYRLLSYRVPTTTTIWVIAAEYFRLFRHGIKGPVIKKEPVLTATTTSLTINQSRRSLIVSLFTTSATTKSTYSLCTWSMDRGLWKQTSYSTSMAGRPNDTTATSIGKPGGCGSCARLSPNGMVTSSDSL